MKIFKFDCMNFSHLSGSGCNWVFIHKSWNASDIKQKAIDKAVGKNEWDEFLNKQHECHNQNKNYEKKKPWLNFSCSASKTSKVKNIKNIQKHLKKLVEMIAFSLSIWIYAWHDAAWMWVAANQSTKRRRPYLILSTGFLVNISYTFAVVSIHTYI